jgi:hypothetical protein
MCTIENLIDIDCVRDVIIKYLNFEDLGLFFTSKYMLSKLDEEKYQNKKLIYEDKIIFCDDLAPIKYITEHILFHIHDVDEKIKYIKNLKMEYRGIDMREFFCELITKK